eukprot:TRINITY_DN32972_c0_g1_i1.p1 TRINITY_DN32972_c0_g1~~TRINITY_DN32972_c0_g1_i1.p1  ORF type:complete len:707 (+),score=190.84 TRINITY_DN32972_c0_g1_i1:135-2123(+)
MEMYVAGSQQVTAGRSLLASSSSSAWASGRAELSHNASLGVSSVKEESKYMLLINAKAADAGSLDWLQLPSSSSSSTSLVPTSTPPAKLGKKLSKQLSNFFKPKLNIAAGLATAVAGIGLGSQVVQTMDSVPVLPQLEMVVGTLVTANFALQYLRGGEGRATLEAFFEDLRRRVSGAPRPAADGSGQESLDSQLSGLVGGNMEVKRVADRTGAVQEVAIVTDKASFTDALRNFILRRESEVESRLQSSVASLEEQLSEEQRKAKDLEQAVVVEKRQALQFQQMASQSELEKSQAFTDLAKMTSQMSGVMEQVTALKSERTRLEQTKLQFESMVTKGEERELLGLHVPPPAFTNSPVEESVSLEAGSAKKELDTRVAEIMRLQREEKERVKMQELAEEAARSLEEDALALPAGAASAGRNQQIAWLETCLKRSPSSEDLQGGAGDSLSGKPVLPNASATTPLVELKQQQLLGGKVAAVVRESAGKKATFEQQVLSLKASLRDAEARIEAAESKAARAVKEARLAKAQAAAMAAALHNKVVKVELGKGPRQPTRVITTALPETAPKTPAEVLALASSGAAMTERELEVYTGLLKPAYLDVSKPARDQLNGVSALVKALVSKGATEGWARRQVLNTHAYDRSRVAMAAGPSIMTGPPGLRRKLYG